MKLSELSTDAVCDALIAMTPCIENICTDEKIMGQMRDKLGINRREMTRGEIMLLGMKKLASLVPLLLKEHRTDVLGIVGAVNDIPPEVVAQQNILHTSKQIADIILDREFLDFFKSCAESGQGK